MDSKFLKGVGRSGARRVVGAILATFVIAAGQAEGALILGTDFTGVVTTASTTATGITWVKNGVSLASPDLVFTGVKKSDGTSFIVPFFSAKGTPEDNIQVNANIETLGSWSTSFTITPADSISLTNFTLDYRAISGSAVDQGPARSAVYTLGITQGAVSLGSFFDNVSDVGGGTPAGDTADIDLSAITLAAGTPYTFTLTVSSPGTLGNNVAIDNLALNGISAIPEPSTAGLGLALLVPVMFRRRARN